ncbi:PREDICTED: QWRF motif-containing protein 2-like [Fragaria vesca subsp. vesca]|uniref:QWRF motif-containing protein 2-like n=1 Tax=Fragaria vesca subsp. vesca TaxID=101020 RepID=UPI0002C2FE03|nr:PREDICTED: QWRF motif-containing protein 2-like [Fragaria vesca subsp. vesca]
MVAAISDPKPTTRPPLLPEKDNASSAAAAAAQRRVVSRGRQVSSKYMSTPSPSSSTSTSTSTTVSSSSVSSRRCPSPLLSRSMNSTPASNSGPKRAQSVDRRRPGTPQTRPEQRLSNAGSEVSAATRLLVTSTRSLSVSFQGEAFSLPISKTKAAVGTPARKPTPERRRSTPVRREGGDQVENSRPGEQHRWPGRSRQPAVSLSRSMECGGSVNNGVGSGVVARALLLQQSMVDESSRGGSRSRSSFDGRLSLDLGHLGGNADALRASHHNPDASFSANESSVPSDLTASDTDSVSSGSTSGVQDSNGAAKSRGGTAVPRGIAVSARFWQETNSRLRRLQDPGSPLATSPVSRAGAAGKYIQSKKFNGGDSNAVSSPRTMSSPIRGATRPASPGKLWTSSSLSPSRGSASPSRARNSFSGPGQLSSGYAASTPSFLSFSIDTRRGKKGEDRIVDAHMLRLLYNRYVQWRFVNARADATYMVQRVNAEENLWNAWVTISELRHNVTLKRVKLLLLRHKLKLTSILKGQITYLEEWALLDRDHSSSLLGANEALQASTLRLPVVGKAIVDFQKLKDSVVSAADVMQAMTSSICSLSSKVEEMNSLVSELVKVTTTERLVLEQCKDFLSTLSAMQVKDCSLRTHIIQLKRLPLPAA